MPISPLDDLRVEDWEEMIDVNSKGVLYGIAAALPVFRKQGFGHFINTASTAGHLVKPNMSVYSGTKFAVRDISEGLRQEAGDKLRVTIISPGFVRTSFAQTVINQEIKASSKTPGIVSRCHRRPSPAPSHLRSSSRPMLMLNEIIVRLTAQG